ncbi:hypothetical protein CKM354_000352700 [Cercospora kikuchii]|uniref:Matrin-type domain-containing protein n=1 Tax=Cercospora kikuchii TaxID=84275 RepID=A0A9P3CGT7_9PEZI|nr:uncharacterized protein CKM354_000352700 [Cercospora kikuchii]GIZ40175.1 hypothetical protein CKM354_000352700 [Cercospora kikuchii]
MSEYWKSTPSYWCKFCSQYVRDTAIERKNHEASAKHQNNIQRSLRELHKGKEREEREKQRAKDEVNRLNGLVSGQKSTAAQLGGASQNVGKMGKPAPAPPPPQSTAQQRKAHAEQLAALGVELPEELKKEATGVGSYQVVDAHEVDTSSAGAVTVNRSLAEILAEARRGEDTVKEEKEISHDHEDEDDDKTGVKRKFDDDDDPRDEEAAPKMRKAWGSTVKTYPGKTEEVDTADLDALLGGVKKKAKTEDGSVVKEEDGAGSTTLNSVPDVEAGTSADVKQEDGAAATPAVVFKKRKGKK